MSANQMTFALHSLFQTLSNGWKEDDVLKIFVRGQNRERRSSCCDLTVRKLREDMVLSETSYDLLWADVDESSGMDSFCSGWLREDVRRYRFFSQPFEFERKQAMTVAVI